MNIVVYVILKDNLSIELQIHTKTSYCSYAQPAQPGLIRLLGPLWTDSVIKLVSVLFGKCTTLLVTKC